LGGVSPREDSGQARGPRREGLRPNAPQGRVTRVLVVTAVDLEARGLARHLGLARVAGCEWPRYRGGALELICAGPRAAYLDARAAGIESVSLVVSAGGCRALSPDL